MKKFLRIFLVIILIIFAVLLVSPILFKQQMLNKAKEIANTSVNAKIDFTDLKLSFFRDFPRLTASLHGVSVSGRDVFEGDTLLAFDEFSATVNVASLVRKEAIKVRSILLDRPRVSAIVLEDGSANWDIAKESGDNVTEETDTEDSGTLDLKVALKKFQIRNALIAYQDRKSDLEASLAGFDLILSGDLALDHTSLDLNSSTERLNLVLGGIRYVKDAALDIGMNLDADLVNSVFTLMENTFVLNELVLMLDGRVTMPEGGDMGVDISFSTKETGFKSLLSMVPAIYMKDFQDVRTDGEISLSGSIKGNLTEEHTPSADLTLLVKNARFEYPDLPKSAENIRMDVDVHYDGIQNDNTTIDVNGFHMELGDNPVDLTMHMVTPISDPKVNATLLAKIDFSTLADVVPLEDVDLAGKLEANIDLMGKMSSIENERYDEFKADGSMKLQQFEVQSPDIPQPVYISSTVMNFSPQFVDLAEFDARIGSSDIRMDGKLENFIPYLFEDGMIAGKLNLESNLLDLNEFMPEEAEKEESEGTEEPPAAMADTAAASVIEIPGNIDFTFTSRLKKVLLNELEIDNLVGLLIIRDRKLTMHELSMNLLKGRVTMSGEYNTQDLKSPLVDLSLDVDRLDIPSVFASLLTIRQLAPIAGQTRGTVSTNLDFTSFLGKGMVPVMNSIVASGKLGSEMVTIEKTETFDMINGLLKTEKFRDITMKDLAIEYSVRNGRVYIEPYKTKIGNTVFVMGGDQGLDQTMNYEMSMKIPSSELGGATQDMINQVTSLAASQGITVDPGETVEVKFFVTGTFTEPKIRPVFGKGTQEITREVREQVQEIVEDKVEEVKEEAREEASREAEKILAEAQARADALKAEAKNAGEELIRLAEEEGQKRIKDAGNNPIQKVAAETYARTLKSEAEKNARKLEEEAGKQADEIMRQAQEQADKLK